MVGITAHRGWPLKEGTQETRYTSGGDLVIGQAFNPYRMFTGAFVPEALCRWDAISPGSKLCYGRLSRYAGQNAECYPSMKTLAGELGISSRHCRRYVRELKENRLIRCVRRYHEGAQTANGFEFLWHEVFQLDGRKRPSQEDESVDGGMTTLSHKESQSKESQRKRKEDLDYTMTNRKKRDSSSCAGNRGPSLVKQFPELREALMQYFREPGQDELYPSARQVVEVMDAALGATEEEVIACLRHLYDDRGLKPGTKNGPRHWRWFPVTVGDYFRRKREREGVANPSGYWEWAARNQTKANREEFERMTAAIEL